MTNKEIEQIVIEAFNHEDAFDDMDTILEHAERACQKVRDLLISAGGPDRQPVRSGVEPKDVK